MKVNELYEKVKERLAVDGWAITRDDFLVRLGGWVTKGEIVIEGDTCRLNKRVDVAKSITESILGAEDE